MPTAVHRRPARTECLLVLLCLLLGVLLLHNEASANPWLKSAALFGLADLSSIDHAPASLDDEVSKKTNWRPSPIFEGAAKLHFVIGLGMFLFIALMVVEDDIMKRALLLVPIVLLFWGSKVLFALDQANMTADMMRRYRPK
jgi:hypothetical protein